ncbi:MAG: two-component sensor histidine kinase, partial [Proteobacteria bacterium]|nr:two-component sensor histidine kinase [Pseudomonadota bacterium]
AQDLHRRLDASRFPEELTDLVNALNGALGRLEGAFARLEAFSSDLAHELRTPLQNLRSELEGRVLRPPKDANLPEILGSLLEELDRLDDMVEQMLFLARGAAPGSAVEILPLSAPAVLQKTVEFFAAQADEARITLLVEAAPECLVRADPRLIHRAILNLAANAIRHTPPGGKVILSAAQETRATRLSVADTGEGIPPNLLPRLGDRFLRVDEGRARATGGAGLGLAIVKGIMELHHGGFQVRSEVGHGTTVTLNFPREM